MSREVHEPCLYIVSGAGLSAESGIPTFRSGDTALWENHSIDEVCYLPNFKKFYSQVHNFYNDRRAEFFSKEPNAGHLQIAEWEQRYGASRVFNITTNIDLLLEKAGCTNVHHVHGRGDEVVRGWDFETRKGTHVENIGEKQIPYEIHALSGEVVKPNVVFFGEGCLHTENGTEPLYQHMYNMFVDIKASDTVIVVGASGVVVPFETILLDVPCLKVMVNIDEVYVTACNSFYDHLCIGTAGETLPRLDSIVKDRMDENTTILSGL